MIVAGKKRRHDEERKGERKEGGEKGEKVPEKKKKRKEDDREYIIILITLKLGVLALFRQVFQSLLVNTGPSKGIVRVQRETASTVSLSIL